jgi:hypothetical protein
LLAKQQSDAGDQLTDEQLEITKAYLVGSAPPTSSSSALKDKKKSEGESSSSAMGIAYSAGQLVCISFSNCIINLF